MTDDKWQKLQATIPWDVLHDTKAPTVAAAPAPSPAYITPMSRTLIPRWVGWAFVALLILGVVLAFALGRVSNVARDIPPALSLPRDTPAVLPVNVAPAGPRRTYGAQMTPDARARTHWLLMCHSGMYWYATRQQAVQAQRDLCGGGGIIHEPIK
jgi:hypothetical protein